MYQSNVFSPVPETTPVLYGDCVNFQMYQAWDGSYFAIPANSAVNNTVNKVMNHSAIPSNQFVPLLPNTHMSAVYTPSVPEGITFSPSSPQPMFHSVSSIPSINSPPISSSHHRPHMINAAMSLPVTPVDQRTTSMTSPAQTSPATENRFNDPFLNLDLQLPFDTLLNNLQEMLYPDQYSKNSSKTMELSPIQPSRTSPSTSSHNQLKPSPSIQHTPRQHNKILPNLQLNSGKTMELSPIQPSRAPHIQPKSSSTLKQLLPNLHVTESSSCSRNQMSVTAREHGLKQKLNQLGKRNPAKVNELSYFLQSQSAQIEMHRLQQLTEAAYPHYKEWLNNECDSQLHQLMERVEVSLEVLEKCSKENRSDRQRCKISHHVSRFLETWYQANIHHPYPTAEMYELLAARTGMHLQQVRKWFSNKRCRLNVIKKQMENKWVNQ